MSKWPLVPLGDIMVSRGGTVNPLKYRDESFELHSIAAHDSGAPDILYGSEIGSSKQVVLPRDVMVSKIVPHIRRVSIVPEASGLRQIASGEWIVFRGDSFVPEYLKHFLLSNAFHSQFMNTVAGVGGSLLRARPENVKAIQLPLPPLPVQRRIAEILDEVDNIRAKRRSELAALDTLPQAVFHELFNSVVEPVETTTLGKIANLVGGRSIVANDQDTDSTFRVLKISAVTSGIYKPNESKSLPDEYIPPERHLVRKGDLLISRANTTELVGAVAYVNQTSGIHVLPDKIWRFDWKIPEPIIEYYFSLFRSPKMRLQMSALASGSGGSMKNISKTKLEQLPIPIPPLSLQQEFARRARAITAQRELVANALTADEELFAALQAAAFLGAL